MFNIHKKCYTSSYLPVFSLEPSRAIQAFAQIGVSFSSQFALKHFYCNSHSSKILRNFYYYFSDFRAILGIRVCCGIRVILKVPECPKTPENTKILSLLKALENGDCDKGVLIWTEELATRKEHPNNLNMRKKLKSSGARMRTLFLS